MESSSTDSSRGFSRKDERLIGLQALGSEWLGFPALNVKDVNDSDFPPQYRDVR